MSHLEYGRVPSNRMILSESEDDLRKLRLNNDAYHFEVPTSAPAMMKRSWPEESHSRSINDNVYGSINVPYPIDKLIDTVAFQRLRNLKQTGLVYLVYPNCEHSRFVHSLGVYHLCFKLLDMLKHREPHLHISSEDHLCVCIAALLHDIGHGPFSHLFDGEYARAVGESWKHEDISKRLIDHLLIKDEKIRNILEPYLGTGKSYETNVKFIKELIGSKRFKNDVEPDLFDYEDLNAKDKKLREEWAMDGRGIEKAFLYDIVSNSYNGHDVDRMDYLLRDSKASGVPIGINYDTITRIFRNLRVVIDPVSGIRKIGYSRKTHEEVKAIGDSRQELHSRVYQHKAVRGIETLMIEAMVRASPYLKYKGSDGRMYKLSEVVKDLDAYLKTSDFIEQEILNSEIENDDMKRAQECLRMIRCRNIPKKIGHCELSPKKAEKIKTNNTGADKNHILDVVKTEMQRYLPKNVNDKTQVLMRELGKGLDATTHPIQRQIFYDKNSSSTHCPTGFYMDEEYVEMNCSQVALKWEIFVMGDRSLGPEARKDINGAFFSAVRGLELISPRKRNHSSESPDTSTHSNARRRLTHSSPVTAT